MEKKEITKDVILKVFRRILSQYKRNTHNLDIDKCQLCKLYYNHESWSIDCTSCPMTIFRGDQNCRCMNRKCRPVDCDDRKYDPDNYQTAMKAVREFYQKAIERIETISEKDFNEKINWVFLLAIDKEISEKYGIE